MNSNDIDDSKPETLTAGPADTPSDAPAKPKRTRKVAAAPTEATDPGAAPAAEETPKPRARRKTAAAAEVPAEAPVEVQAGTPAAEDAPASKPKRRTTKK